MSRGIKRCDCFGCGALDDGERPTKVAERQVTLEGAPEGSFIVGGDLCDACFHDMKKSLHTWFPKMSKVQATMERRAEAEEARQEKKNSG